MSNFKEYDLGITPSATWDIMDATKWKSFLACERMFFFEYVLGWRPAKNIHLSYGSLIHDAIHAINIQKPEHRTESVSFWSYLETIIKCAAFKKSFVLSQVLFEGIFLLSEDHPYRVFMNSFPRDPAEWDAHKNPVKGLLSLILYEKSHTPYVWYTFKNAKGESETAVEIGGTIALADDKTLSYRLDGLSVEGDKIIPVEFKTGRSSSFWLKQWDTDIQVTIYSLVAYLLNGSLDGLYIHGLLNNSTTINDSKGLDFTNPFRHVCYEKSRVLRSRVELNNFLSDLEFWWQRLCLNYEKVSRTRMDSELCGFPRNYKNCTNYYGRPCPYLDYCVNPNILKRVILEGYQPAEFNIDFWNPLEDVKKELNVGNGRF